MPASLSSSTFAAYLNPSLPILSVFWVTLAAYLFLRDPVEEAKVRKLMTGIALPLFTASPLHDAGSSPKIGKTPGSLRALTASDSWKEKTDKTREGSEQQQSSCHWKLIHVSCGALMRRWSNGAGTACS